MKKRIALGLALALAASVGTTAFAAAANPFTDVPAKHWSYNAIQQLSKAGIVEGYNDGQFKGDRTITRYEMAVIVAKAMAKEDKADASQRAIIDKLAAEFSSELDNLGVRVSTLEKKVGNIRFSADARIRWDSVQGNAATPATKTVQGQSYSSATLSPYWKDRFRLNMNADINDTTSVYARYIYNDSAFLGNSNRLSDLAFTTKNVLGNTAVTVGRYTLNLGPTTFVSGTTGGIEGVQTNTKAGNINLMLGYADASAYMGSNSTTSTLLKNIGYAEAKFALGDQLTVNADYFMNQADAGIQKYYKVVGGGVTYALNSDWKVIGEYYQNSSDIAKAANGNKSPKAYIARIAYKGAQAAVPGTWGGFVEYTDFQTLALPYDLAGPYTKVGNFTPGGLKSYDVNFNYTLAKNITFEGVYQFNMKDIKADKDVASGSDFVRAQINYFF
jgi:hypothetical protein